MHDDRQVKFKAAQIGAILLIGCMLYGGLLYGQYSTVQRLSSDLCLSCLGLEYRSPPFTGFWIEYPVGHKKANDSVPHPDWATEMLSDGVVFIFVWAEGCTGCKAQWDDMKSRGLVSGEEATGAMSRYINEVTLITVDASADARWDDIKHIYDPAGQNIGGIPLTVFLTLVQDEHGKVTIGWYSYKSQMPSADVDEVLRSATFYYELNRDKWAE